MATSYLDITKDNLSQFSKDIFTKVKDERYLTSVDFEDLVPLASKTYQNIIATANSQAAGTFYCLQIFPDDVYTPCRIKLRVRVYLNSDMTVSTAKSFYQEHYIEFVTMGTSFVRYVTDNAIYSTSYRPIYYNTIYRALADGITAGYPHYFGPSLYNSTSPTSSSYKRDFEITVFEIEGGSFAFLDEPILASSFYNSTYYNALTNINATSQGKIGTGMSSSNTYDRAFLNTVTALAAATLYGSQLVLSADGYNYYSITKSRSTGTSHTINQVPFDPTFLYYYNASTTVATGSRTATNLLYTDIPFDFRYSSNCGSNLTAQKPVYLVATKDNDTGLYTLIASNWWTQSPSDENYYYIYLGIAYSTTSVHMEVKHPVYIVQNETLKPASDVAAAEAANTAKSEAITAAASDAASKYVALETGKGLSANDFTDTLKTKLDDIEEGAEANVIENIEVNGVSGTITNKVATVSVSLDAIATNTAENYVIFDCGDSVTLV